MTLVLPCPCCQSAMKNVSSGTYPEYTCIACDHVHFENPVGISAEDYEQSEKYQDYYTDTPPSLWYHKRALRIISQACPEGRILDFGCYDGFFVRAMRDQGLNAYGCDWNRDAITHGKCTFYLEDQLSRNPDGTYDAIVALEVIEHFTDPQDFFASITPHLASDGMIVLSCPNKNSCYRPSTDCPPHHFSRFSTTSLNQIVERHGFTVVKHETEMSSFQMLRNYVGDRMRKQHTFQADQTGVIAKDDGRYQLFRRSANASADVARLALTPVDLVLRAAGCRYLSQVIWAKRS